MITEEHERPKGFMDWLRESVMVKLSFIAFLILILLIPSSLIQNLINEREARQDDMMKEVSSQWSGSQLVQGPVLMIPYRKHEKVIDNGKEAVKETISNLYILPNELHISAKLVTETLHRGIFEVPVYNSKVEVGGNFSKLNLNDVSLTQGDLIPEKAKLLFSLSDLKGLKTNPVVNVAGQTPTAEPAFGNYSAFDNGLQAAVNLSNLADKDFRFSYTLDLKGSEEISFTHLGKTTTVEASGDWGTPSFDGRYLPDERKITPNSFSAKWRMLYYNRPFPQQWLDSDTLLKNSKKNDAATFGVKLKLPVDQYQKTTRTSKYAILIILLTFISLFLTEVIRKQKVHVFNYVLIGAAMIVYYTLLLSFTERIGFNAAYAVASVATIGLLTVFIWSLLKNGPAALFLSLILSIFYAFIFIIIQLEDLALLVGSVALFLIVGALMYFSRKINWDRN